jgi:hypothetical protein
MKTTAQETNLHQAQNLLGSRAGPGPWADEFQHGMLSILSLLPQARVSGLSSWATYSLRVPLFSPVPPGLTNGWVHCRSALGSWGESSVWADLPRHLAQHETGLIQFSALSPMFGELYLCTYLHGNGLAPGHKHRRG